MASQPNDDSAKVEKPRRVVSLAGSVPGFGYGGRKVDLTAGVLERLMGPLTSAEPRQQSGSAVCRFYPHCRAGSRCSFSHVDPESREGGVWDPARRSRGFEPQSWNADSECRECGCTVKWGLELCPRCVDATPEASPERWQPSSPSVECHTESPRSRSKDRHVGRSSSRARRKRSPSSSKSKGGSSSSASSSSPSSSSSRSSASSDSRRKSARSSRSSARHRRRSRESRARRSRSRRSTK
mmetsp:Transcript_27743/g.66788  ORF Transcript_27743/g.66788 Transcript_27743/m.66788 type:complete len:240 (+) Transcript_27743:125-844(+)